MRGKFAPSTFTPETNTVWSFPDRGDYANKQVCTYGTLAIRECDVNWRNG